MNTHKLFDSFLSPERPPERPYSPDSDVFSIRTANDISAIAEIYESSSGSYGFRFQAWVAWRDAGGVARSHSWYEINAKEALFTDRVAEAQCAADAYAAAIGISLIGDWHSPR